MNRDLFNQIEDFFKSIGYGIETFEVNLETEILDSLYIGNTTKMPIALNKTFRINISAIEVKNIKNKTTQQNSLPQKRKFDAKFF